MLSQLSLSVSKIKIVSIRWQLDLIEFIPFIGYTALGCTALTKRNLKALEDQNLRLCDVQPFIIHVMTPSQQCHRVSTHHQSVRDNGQPSRSPAFVYFHNSLLVKRASPVSVVTPAGMCSIFALEWVISNH